MGKIRRITIIGSTGSVGENTLKVVDHLSPAFEIAGLAVSGSVELLARQCARYQPSRVAIADGSAVRRFRAACTDLSIRVPDILEGPEAPAVLAADGESDIVVAAAVGSAGLRPAYAAITAGKQVALANKEALVVAGQLLRDAARRSGAVVLPVDSEHSALDQCLRSGQHGEVFRLLLTASGGPFLKTPRSEFATITPEAALAHPTWTMGQRITIDSSTLMNKGFEVIEARWLFDIPPTSIDIVVHPQSIVHSMVEFVDGSVVAQLSATDMRGPIQYALTYPQRVRAAMPSLDWNRLPALEFSLPDRGRFPSIDLAYDAMKIGGTAPAVLNAADEIAVRLFLERRIGFEDVPRLVASVLAAHSPKPADSVDGILEADTWARARAEQLALHGASPRA